MQKDKNIFLSQNEALDLKVSDLGLKILMLENKLRYSQEDTRRAMADIKAYRILCQNLESTITTHENEKNQLLRELKKYTRGKVRSNVLEAELYRKQKTTMISKSSIKATAKMYESIQKAGQTQTDLKDIKKRLIYVSDKDYERYFVAIKHHIAIQTVPVVVMTD